MAVTQYIGARYVPMFYTASDNSNSWEAGVQYDPLTVVTYLNQSYTSKIPVPASVGNPADNPTYWILTGAYNAQVNQLSMDVSQNTADITELQQITGKRTFILLGDSFEYGIDGNNPSQQVPGGGWGARCQTMLENAGHTVYRLLTPLGGGIGFASSRTYESILTYMMSNVVPDGDLITDIVVLGGHNDIGLVAQVPQAIEDFVDYAITVCPNARIKIGTLGTSLVNIWNYVVPAYREGASLAGVEFTDSLTNLFCDPQYLGSDALHLSTSGYIYYSPFVLQGILGEADYNISVSFPVTIDTSKVSAGTLTFKQTYTPGAVICWFDGENLSLVNPPTAQVNIVLGTMASTPPFRLDYYKLATALFVGTATNGYGAFMPGSGSLFTIGNQIAARLTAASFPPGNVQASWKIFYNFEHVALAHTTI